MDKTQALQTLISSSYLKPEVKDRLLTSLAELSEEDVNTLGAFLAKYHRQQISAKKKAVEKIDSFLEHVGEGDKKSP